MDVVSLVPSACMTLAKTDFSTPIPPAVRMVPVVPFDESVTPRALYSRAVALAYVVTVKLPVVSPPSVVVITAN